MRKLIIGGVAALALGLGGVAAGSTGAHVGDDNDTNLPGKGRHGHGLITVGDVNVSADCAGQVTNPKVNVLGLGELLSPNTSTAHVTCEPRKAEKNK